jgi:hypothetical protein
VAVHIATETHYRLSELSLRIFEMLVLDAFKVRFWYSDFLGNMEPCNLDLWVVRRVLAQIELLLLLLLLHIIITIISIIIILIVFSYVQYFRFMEYTSSVK